MVLATELVLTVMAWRKGWRGWALLPMAGCLACGWILGGILVATGTDVSYAAAVLLSLPTEVAVIVALALMARRAPRSREHGYAERIPEHTGVIAG